MKVDGEKGLVKAVLLQLKKSIEDYPIIGGINQISINYEELNNCCSYFIRLEILLKTFEEKLPPYMGRKWVSIKNKEITINGGLFFYISEIEKYIPDLNSNIHDKFVSDVEEILEYIGFPVCKYSPGIITYILV